MNPDKACSPHQFHSCCTDGLLWPCDWSPSAQPASAAGCPRTAAWSPGPPLGTEGSCRPGTGCKKKTFFNKQNKIKRSYCLKKKVQWYPPAVGPPSWARPAGKHTLQQWNKALNTQARKPRPLHFSTNQLPAHVFCSLPCLVTFLVPLMRNRPDPPDPAGTRPPT